MKEREREREGGRLCVYVCGKERVWNTGSLLCVCFVSMCVYFCKYVCVCAGVKVTLCEYKVYVLLQFEIQ